MAEIINELKENFKEIKKIIESQKFTVKDANFYLERYYNIVRCIEGLEKSRDGWKYKYEKLKEKNERNNN